MSDDLLVQMAHYGRIYLINMIAMLREGTFYQDTKLKFFTLKIVNPFIAQTSETCPPFYRENNVIINQRIFGR